MIFRASSERGVDPHVMDFLASLSMAFADSEIDLVVHIASPADQMRHHMRIASRGQVDGMLLSAPEPNDPRFEMLDRRGIPFVVHGRGEDSPSYAFYDIDNDGAFAAATSLLADLGHKRIALLNGPSGLAFVAQREAGFRRITSARGIVIPSRFVTHDEMSEDLGYRRTAAMLSGAEGLPPTAFLCSSTLMALGVIRAAAAHGLRIGSDISIIAHDDVLPHLRSEHFSPALTVTRSPIRDAGTALAEMIVARIGGVDPLKLQRIVAVDLIARSSTGPAPKSGEQAWQR